MKIGDLLYFFRQNNQQKQIEIIDDTMSVAKFSRVESVNAPLKLDDLIIILDNLSVTIEEFSIYYQIEHEQRAFKQLIKTCTQRPDNPIDKEKMIAFFEQLKPDDYLQDFSNHLAVKMIFGDRWEEIPAMTEQDIQQAFDYLNQRLKYTHYDFVILRNICSSLNFKQINSLIGRIFPLKPENAQNESILQFVSYFFLNIVSLSLHKNELEQAEEYLEFARHQKELIPQSNYYYWMNLQYLSDLWRLLQTNDFEAYERVKTYIQVVDNIGLHDDAEAMRKEFESLIKKENKLLLKKTVL